MYKSHHLMYQLKMFDKILYIAFDTSKCFCIESKTFLLNVCHAMFLRLAVASVSDHLILEKLQISYLAI